MCHVRLALRPEEVGVDRRRQQHGFGLAVAQIGGRDRRRGARRGERQPQVPTTGAEKREITGRGAYDGERGSSPLQIMVAKINSRSPPR